MRRSASTALLVLALGACALPVDDHARAIAPEKLPDALAATTSAPSSTAGEAAGPSTTRSETSVYRLWFISGDALQGVTREMPRGATPDQLIDRLVAGPSGDEVDRSGLRSAIPTGTITSTELRGGVALVDLGPSFVAIPTGDQILAVGQLVLTLTGLPGVGQVGFEVDGAPVQVPRADGSQADGPVARDDYLPLTQTS
jgi:spore germination protein GerM